MNYPIASCVELIDGFYAKMVANEDIADSLLPDGEWTLRDMVAHLIDSFTNNHQRFIRLQLQERLEFPAYDAEQWRSVSKVDSLDYRSLAGCWKACNEYLLAIIQGIDESALSHVWVRADGEKTLGFLVDDYFSHIRWHIDFFDTRVAALRGA
jgi:hypothetical protein